MPVYIPEKYATKKTVEGDILLARYGASLGKVFLSNEGAYNVALAKITILYKDILNKKYLFYFYKSVIYKRFISDVTARTAQGGFNKEEIDVLLLPLPPISEQERIANKINQYFYEIG